MQILTIFRYFSSFSFQIKYKDKPESFHLKIFAVRGQKKKAHWTRSQDLMDRLN